VLVDAVEFVDVGCVGLLPHAAIAVAPKTRMM